MRGRCVYCAIEFCMRVGPFSIQKIIQIQEEEERVPRSPRITIINLFYFTVSVPFLLSKFK